MTLRRSLGRSALALALVLAIVPARHAAALERPEAELKIFQFPANAIPRIDGDAGDWAMVKPGYAIGSDMLAADDGSGARPDPKSLSVSVRVGWVKGLNRLYFLYEATDDYWDFASPGLRQDIFELAVDGDRSGGPFIARFHPDLAPGRATAAPARPTRSSGAAIADGDAWFGFQNVQAQNYHIFTPARNKDWAMAWGPQAAWIKRLPYSNIAYRYAFQPGQPGKLTMEFWITPFDHAAAEGPGASAETVLAEDAIIGMAWAVIDYDGPHTAKRHFWNLSPRHDMYGQASGLRAFRLMPIEPERRPPIEADWSFTIVDRARRTVAFRDESHGATRWQWDFGDGHTSTEQHPIHRFDTPGKFVVILHASGPGGSATLSKVWDVSFTGDPPE